MLTLQELISMKTNIFDNTKVKIVWHKDGRKGYKDILKDREVLLDADQQYFKNFQFTVLQSLPSNLNSSEVVKLEGMYKRKLGTKVYGLNGN